MTELQKKLHHKELRQLYHHRGFYALLLTILLFFAFAPLDYLLAPDLFTEFLQYRLAISAFFLLLVYLNYRDVELQYVVAIPIVAYFLSLLLLNLMIMRMGGISSPYFAGVIVAIVIFTAMLPLTMVQVLIGGFTGIGMYLLAVFLCCPLMEGQQYILVNNFFFMSGFVLLVAVQSWYDTRAREESFLLRLQEEEAAEQLDRQAELLEQEVSRRYEEHQRKENRFRLLFEHIADDVILVDETGELIYANPPFFNHLCLVQGAKINLADLVEAGDRQQLHSELLAPLAGGTIVTGYQTRFHPKEGTVLDVEINGSRLERHGEIVGLQLVIRDISLRIRMEQELHQNLQVRKHTENATIMALARLSEHRDVNPHRHLEGVREYSRLLAEELAASPEYRNQLAGSTVSDLSLASVLHDIGKVGIPDAILFKSGLLTAEEMDKVRRHTIFGGDVVKSMESPDETSGFLYYAKNIAYFHHEKWDGSGYPFGLIGDEIPLAARIVALADAYDAMTSTGQYGKQLSHQQALHTIIQDAGSHFDPAIVDAFLFREQEFDEVRRKMMTGREGNPPEEGAAGEQSSP